MSQKRSARSKSSKNAFWKLTLIMGALLIVVAGIGTYYYDQGVRKQNIAYEKQLDFKHNEVVNNIKRIGGVNDFEMI